MRSLLAAAAWLTMLALHCGASALAGGGDDALPSVSTGRHLDADAIPFDRGTTTTFPSRPHDEETLVEWATRVASILPPPSTQQRNETAPFLVIGIKTSVLHHFPQRQAIRETWANATNLDEFSVRVVFLGCEPDLSPFRDTTERAAVVEAIAREKQLYRDLLTSELECVDSYAQLLRKTVSFLHWVIASLQVHYVMIADDDVFVDIARLVDKLRHDTPTKRFYGGYVFRDLKPQRDPGHKNFIPQHEYPTSTLPPFVGGPHYVMSVDLARYIARNHTVLRGLRALDDVSIALWLLAIRVHPVHVREFILLRTSPCHPRGIALADLSPSSVRQLHKNVITNSSLCHGLVGATALRRHRSIVLLPEAEGEDQGESDTKLKWELYHNATSYAVHIGVTITVSKHQISYQFVPSAKAYESGLCLPGANLLLSQLYVTVGSAFCQYHRRKLLAFIDDTIEANPKIRALLALPRHNLAALDIAIITVGLSYGARYARILIECLLVKIYPTSRILVLSEDTLEASPDLFFFSILDGDHNDSVPDGARYVSKYGTHSQVLMISGETWPLEHLDPHVTLVTTLARRHHPKQLYLPVVSTVFGEIVQHSPLDLLRSYSDRVGLTAPRRFCAYLYARCDRLRREYMFDLLNDIEPVDALGACQGAKRDPTPRKSTERYTEAFYTDIAIAKYTNYRFVIAFENSVAPGYVTEKIVTAFLAGAIPIYFGHSPTVNRIFNRAAFINCADFESLRSCAQRVISVHKSPAAYETMRRAPPIVDQTAFFETFSWHPAVADMRTSGISPMTEQLHELLERGQ